MKQLPLNLKDEVDSNVYCNPQILFGIRDGFIYLLFFFLYVYSKLWDEKTPLSKLLKHLTQKQHKSI